MLDIWKKRIFDYYAQHEKLIEISFFVGGFVFDVLFLSAVDDFFSLLQQTIYLFVIAIILHYEILFRFLKWRPQGALVLGAWKYRELFLHFLLGSLLSIYSLFYIKSSSFVSSLIFLGLMVALLIANELPVIKKSTVSLKMGLYAICLFSFVSILFPLAFGFVGWIPFGLSVATTAALFYSQFAFLRKQFGEVKLLFQAVLFPGVSVLIVFSFFYFAGWIPPVPISAKEQGIYYLVEKQSGKFILSSEKTWWRFRGTGDTDFKARPGDKVHYYMQIYSPARFADQIYVRWLFKDPKLGWQKTDRIPLTITGGREQGFRASTSKSNYQPGQWRVQIETSMGHEISRLDFTITLDTDTEPREFEILER